MIMKIGDIRRGMKSPTSYINFSSFFFIPLLGKLTLLCVLPAVFYGCTPAADLDGCSFEMAQSFGTARSPVRFTDDMEDIRNLDVFVFMDDKKQKLDCYQRFDDMTQWKGSVISGSGKRIMTVIANSSFGRQYWMSMNSRAHLKGVSLYLGEEMRGRPVMSGEVSSDTEDSSDAPEEMVLEPYVGEVVLNSIRCDFKGKPYSGEKLSAVRVYLINVNTSCPVLTSEGSPPSRIINLGRLCEEDLEDFEDPGIIVRDISGEIGTETVHPDIRLWCYPGSHPEETPGTPYTRLVIEGKVSGHTYYWPVDINRDSRDEAGIWRNRRYSYDILITRKGSTDPNTPVRAEDITIKQEVTKWKEKEEYSISF